MGFSFVLTKQEDLTAEQFSVLKRDTKFSPRQRQNPLQQNLQNPLPRPNTLQGAQVLAEGSGKCRGFWLLQRVPSKTFVETCQKS